MTMDEVYKIARDYNLEGAVISAGYDEIYLEVSSNYIKDDTVLYTDLVIHTDDGSTEIRTWVG